jgi:uncharacterized protein YecT (DUF1311 family)
MARITFNNRSVRTAVGTATLGIAAAMVLGACGSSSPGVLGPVAAASPSTSGSPVARDAAEAPAEKVTKTEKVAAEPSSAAKKKSPARSAAPAPKKAADLKYVKIVEPFGSPGRCDEGGTTIEMTACVLKKVVDVDYTVDVLQRQRFGYGISTADRQASLRDDANWLAKRTKKCSANPSGGSMDQITQAQCLLKVSKARVAALS